MLYKWRFFLSILLCSFLGAASFFFLERYVLIKPIPDLEKFQAKRVGVIDTAKIREDVVVYQQFGKLAGESYRKSHQDILAYETQLRAEYEQLANLELNQKDQKPSKEMIEKKEEFERRYQEVQQKVKNDKEEFEKKFGDIKEKIEQELKKNIQDLAKEKELDLLINIKGQDFAIVLFHDASLDLTKEVIERINKQVPSLDVFTK